MKIIHMAIGAMVTIMLIVISIPVTSSFAEEMHYSVEKNEGGIYTLVEDDEKVTVEINNTSSTATINGKSYDIAKYGSYLISDYALMGFIPQTNAYHTIFTETLTYRLEISSTPKTLKMTFENGTATMEITAGGTTTTYTGEYTYLFHYNGGSGDYIQVSSAEANRINVNLDSDIFFVRNGGVNSETIIGGPFKAGDLTGTGTYYTNGSGNVPTSQSIEISWSLTDNGNQSYVVTGATYGSDATATTIGMVPLKYTVYNESSMTASLVEFMPLFMGLGLFIVMGMFLVKSKME